MVRHLIVRAIISIGKSVFQAYKNVSNNQQGQAKAAPNQYSEFLRQAMQSTNMIHTPITIEEAYKILNIDSIPEEENEKIDIIMKQYIKLFNKNNLPTSGSPYLRSKIYNSKVILLQQYKSQEYQWYIENKVDPDSLISTEEPQEETKDNQKEQQQKKTEQQSK